MNTLSTLQPPLEPSGEHPRQRGFGPLRWLRRRFAGSPSEAPASSLSSLMPAFPPPVGRGHALRLAHQALRAHFLRQEGMRQVWPHLSLLEQALGRKGSKALSRLPASVLQRALEQLEAMQASGDDPALATLRTRLVESLALRSVTRPRAARLEPESTGFGLEVRELPSSAFDDAEFNWHRSGNGSNRRQ